MYRIHFGVIPEDQLEDEALTKAWVRQQATAMNCYPTLICLRVTQTYIDEQREKRGIVTVAEALCEDGTTTWPPHATYFDMDSEHVEAPLLVAGG